MYTDGSVEGGISRGGGGIVISQWDGTEKKESIPAGHWCCSLRVEAAALHRASELLLELPRRDTAVRIAIFTESKSLLEKTQEC